MFFIWGSWIVSTQRSVFRRLLQGFLHLYNFAFNKSCFSLFDLIHIPILGLHPFSPFSHNHLTKMIDKWGTRIIAFLKKRIKMPQCKYYTYDGGNTIAAFSIITVQNLYLSASPSQNVCWKNWSFPIVLYKNNNICIGD